MNLNSLIENRTLAGAVTLIAGKDGRPGIETFGYADMAEGKLMEEDALFWIASVTKPVTAVATMMLVDEGKISLDERVERYLPEFGNRWILAEEEADRRVLRKAIQPMLVRHLLSNLSGLPFGSLLEMPTRDLHSLSLGVKGYAMLPLSSEPGSRYLYSNAGFNTLGRIIEVVTGSSYEDFLDERLLSPLGMKDTTFFPGPEQLSRLARNYKRSAEQTGLEEVQIDQLFYPLDGPDRKPMPAGGLFSTAADLLCFGRMLLQRGVYQGKRYLSENAFQNMTTEQTAHVGSDSYGFGLKISGNGFGHGGACNNQFHVNPRDGVISILMVQQPGDWETADYHKIFPAIQKEAVEKFGR